MSERKRPEVTESLPKLKADVARVKVHEWSIEVSAGPDKGRKVKTLESLVRVGTDATNDLVLSDPTVSRRHVEIERTAKGFVVRDLGSRNGVLLEGHQVLQAYVAPGEKISIGKTRLGLKQEAKPTEVEVTGDNRFGELFGDSDEMRAVFALLRKVSREDNVNVLLEGETGTGKELAARAIHQHSGRRHGPFKVVDCSMLTEANAERELTAPTPGAVPPVFDAAIGGTLFLDEVGELPASVQPRLLRLLENPDLDVRVISSTNRNLDDEVRHDRFRKELFFRVAKARVRLPPLRTRRQELLALCAHLLSHLNARVELSPQTLALFEGYDWPGNVRELRNVLERGALMQETGNANWLDFLAQPKSEAKPTQSVSDVLTRMAYHDARDRVVGDFERIYFAEVMRQCGFDMKVAEEHTGLSMQSLYRLLKKSGLSRKELKNAEGLDR